MNNRFLLALPILAPLPALAGPDVIVADIPQVAHWGEVGGVHAYSFSVTACNIGDAELDWFANSNRHPVRASQLYRLSDGRFEQIGLGSVKHEFAALQMNVCGFCEPADGLDRLGVGCSTVDSATASGGQHSLGPRTEINPASGDFVFPFTGAGQTGDTIFKRLRASEADLSTPGARYFFEGHTIAPDDADAGNGDNNASWREAVFNPATYNATLTGTTTAEQPAIYAWRLFDPTVQLSETEAPDGGRIIIGSRAEQIAGGEWAYEYAVYNMNSATPIVGFEAPHAGRRDFSPAHELGFHDVDYHSGDDVDPTDWPGEVGPFRVAWGAPGPVLGELTNDVKWGTLYNFHFVSPFGPGYSSVWIEFEAGDPETVIAITAGDLRCSDADFAEPYFVLDLLDIQSFLQAFLNQDGLADLAEPFGVYDLADLQLFIGAFVAGCG